MPVVTKKTAAKGANVSSAMRKSIAAGEVRRTSMRLDDSVANDGSENEEEHVAPLDLTPMKVDTPITSSGILDDCKNIALMEGDLQQDVISAVDELSSSLEAETAEVGKNVVGQLHSMLGEFEATYSAQEVLSMEQQILEMLPAKNKALMISRRIQRDQQELSELMQSIGEEDLEALSGDEGDILEGLLKDLSLSFTYEIATLLDDDHIESVLQQLIENKFRVFLAEKLPDYTENVIKPQLQSMIDDDFEFNPKSEKKSSDREIKSPAAIQFDKVMRDMRVQVEERASTTTSKETQLLSLKVAMKTMNAPVTFDADGNKLTDKQQQELVQENADEVKRLRGLVNTFDTIVIDQKREMFDSLSTIYPGIGRWSEHSKSVGKNSLSMFELTFPEGIASTNFDTTKSKELLKSTLSMCQAYIDDLYALVPFVQMMLDHEDPMVPVKIPLLSEMKDRFGDILGGIVVSQVGTLYEIYDRKNSKLLAEHTIPLETGGDGEPLRSSHIEEANALTVLGYFVHWNEQDVSKRRRAVQACLQHASSYFVDGDIIEACERYSKHVQECADLRGEIDYHSSIHECSRKIRGRENAVELYQVTTEWMNDSMLSKNYERNCVSILPRFIASIMKVAKSMSNSNPPASKGESKEEQARSAASKAFLTNFNGGSYLGKTGQNQSTWCCAKKGCNVNIAEFIVAGYADRKGMRDHSKEPDFHPLLCQDHHKSWEKGEQIELNNGSMKFAKGSKGATANAGSGQNKKGQPTQPNPNLTDAQREKRRQQRKAYKARVRAKKGLPPVVEPQAATPSTPTVAAESPAKTPPSSDSAKISIESNGNITMSAAQFIAMTALNSTPGAESAETATPQSATKEVHANAAKKELDVYQQLIQIVSSAKDAAQSVTP